MKYLYLFLISVLLLPNFFQIYAQVQEYRIPLTCQTPTYYLPDTVWFGGHKDATYCIDQDLGEYELPPSPPPMVFDVRFIDNRIGTGRCMGEGLKLDLRPWLSSVSRDTFQISLQAGDDYPLEDDYQLEVRWPNNLSTYLYSAEVRVVGGTQVVNMLTATEIVINNTNVCSLKIFTEVIPRGLSYVRVNLPDIIVLRGTSVEIPINVGNLTDYNILSYQFQIDFNTPDNFLTVSDTVITTGTISGQSGWTVMANNSVPNRINVGAFGANPLTGEGILLKLRFRLSPTAIKDQFSNLIFSDFTFNAGTPLAITTNGKITVKTKECGDTDENLVVQAYDASMVLREVLGLNNPPLTEQGKENGDVDENGFLQAYDAALILRHVIGLSQPVSTCFGTLTKSNTINTDISDIKINITDISNTNNKKTLSMMFDGISREREILAISFDIELPNKKDNSTNVEVKNNVDGYIYALNKIDNKRYRIGIINPSGISGDEVSIQITIESPDRQMNEIQIKNLLVNSQSLKDIRSIVTTIPIEFSLSQNYPNPFNPQTTIRYALSSDVWVTLKVYDILGREVMKLVEEYQSAGTKVVEFDAADLPSGVYYYKLTAGIFTDVKKMILTK